MYKYDIVHIEMENKDGIPQPRFFRSATREVARMAMKSFDATTRPFAEQMAARQRGESVVFRQTAAQHLSLSTPKVSLNLDQLSDQPGNQTPAAVSDAPGNEKGIDQSHSK